MSAVDQQSSVDDRYTLAANPELPLAVHTKPIRTRTTVCCLRAASALLSSTMRLQNTSRATLMLSATERGLRAVGRARFAHEPQASAAFTGGERCRSTVDGSSLCAVGASNKQRNPGLAPSARADRSPKGAPKSPVHTGSEPARKFASARTNLQNLGSSDGAHAVHAEVE